MRKSSKLTSFSLCRWHFSGNYDLVLFPAGNKELFRTTRLYSFFQKFSPGWQITESAKAKFYRQYYQGTCIRIWIYNNNQKVSNSSKLVLC